jgi:DNA-binding transcriptional regulator YbjK
MPNHERPRRARGEQRRKQLLDAAIEVILESGVSAATHRAIAARAGVPAASTTYFFPSIDALIGEALVGVLAIELERLGQLQERINKEGMSTADAIDAYVEVAMAMTPGNVIAQIEMYLSAPRRPSLKAYVHQVLEATRQAAASALKIRGIQSPAAAAALTSMVEGFALHRLAQATPQDTEDLRTSLQALIIGFQTLEIRGS